MTEPIGITVDPEIDSSTTKPLAVYTVSGNTTTYQSFPATSVGNNTATFNIQAPSMDTYMNRAVRVEYPLTFNFTGTQGGSTDLLQSGMDALRSYADMRMLTNQIVTINGTVLPSATVYDTYVDILAHYNHTYQKLHPLSAVDPAQEYSYSLGAINNPLSDYASSETFEQGGAKRGAYPIATSYTNGSTSASITYMMTSWVYIPELLGVDQKNSAGLCRLRSFNLNYTLDTTSLTKYWSHDDTSSGHGTITSATVTLGNNCVAYCKFITPPEGMKPKGPLTFRHYRMERFTTSINAPLTVGSTTTINANNVQLPNIPHFVYFFVRESDNYKSITSTDTFARINNVSIDFNNQSALLSSASPNDLFMISKDCGLIDNLTMFSGTTIDSGFDGSLVGTVGSLFCAEFGRHISLGDASKTIGSPGQFSFAAHINVTNVNQSNQMTQPTLYMIIAYDQDMTISEGGDVSISTPVVPVANLASGAGLEGGVVHLPYDVNGQFGGSFKDFFRGVKNFFHKTQLLSKVGSVLAPMLPPGLAQIASTAVDVAKEHGYGEGEGGRYLSKKDLKSLIRKL